MSAAPTVISPREGYDLWAPRYGREANPLLALQERRMEAMLPAARGLRIVDLACGTGRWMERLARRAPKSIVGLDFSEAMLRRANDVAGLTGRTVCADCSALPLQNQCADLVLCSLALDHIADLEAFAREAARIADDGAIVVLSEFHPAAHDRGWKRTFRSGDTSYELEVTPRALEVVHDALKREGLILAHCDEPGFGEPERRFFVEAGKEELFESIRNSGPALFIARYIRSARRCRVTARRNDVQITGARMALGPSETHAGDIAIQKGRVAAVENNSESAEATLDLSGYLILPGLVNAHDHLEFGLYPRLGYGPYGNAREWARDIYRPDCSPIREHRLISKDTRLWWGALKNLLCGVTTVSHHNPYADVFDDPAFPIRVISEFGWAHSFAEEPDVKGKFAATPEGSPFLIHLGEGTDEIAAEEFQQLCDAGAVDPRTVLVHAVALTEQQREQLARTGAAIVWCPSSNRFMLGTTLGPRAVDAFPRAALGSDSPLTSAGDLLDEIAVARSCGVLPERLYDMVTTLPSNVLNTACGEIRANGPGDLIVVRDRGLSPAETLASMSHADVELVFSRGRVRLVSPELLQRWSGVAANHLERIVIDETERYVAAPVARLLNEANRCLGDDVRLAGKRVSQ